MCALGVAPSVPSCRVGTTRSSVLESSHSHFSNNAHWRALCELVQRSFLFPLRCLVSVSRRAYHFFLHYCFAHSTTVDEYDVPLQPYTPTHRSRLRA